MIDSLPGVFIKSTALRREKKMMSFLQEIQPLIDIGKLSFYTKQTWRDSRAKEFIVASLLGVPWPLMLASQDIGN